MENSPKVSTRVHSIDIVRGAIMVMMALDHVRDFFHITAFSADPLDPKTTNTALFFTRWITHFCAPAFMLLSGISAYLSGQRQTLAAKSLFLIKRGIWLIFVEVVIMTFALTFDPSYSKILLMVIWALGCSMIVLGILIRFVPPAVVLIVGLALIFGHNIFDYFTFVPNSTADVLANIFFTAVGKFYPAGGRVVGIMYVILPWSGIMLSGYGMGALYRSTVAPERRKATLFQAGGLAIALFVVLRFVNMYGDPAPWSTQDSTLQTLFSFLNVSKYPPSLMYTLMTIGPLLISLALLDSVRTKWTDRIRVFGKVPFFFYVVHFYLIHFFSALAVLSSDKYTWEQVVSPKLFFLFRPFDFGYELPHVYLIWATLIFLLYWPCKGFAEFKGKHKDWRWLSYI